MGEGGEIRGADCPPESGRQYSPPRIGGGPERSEGGLVDQVPTKILQSESDLPSRLAVARRPLLFQEGSFASQSVKYIEALTEEGVLTTRSPTHFPKGIRIGYNPRHL